MEAIRRKTSVRGACATLVVVFVVALVVVPLSLVAADPTRAEVPAATEASPASPVALLDPNLASEAELLGVPGLTAELTKSLMARRPFLRTHELHNFLDGSLDSTQIAGVYQRLFLPINLNTATAEEILLVPGVGRRMQHEFEEYRPYRSIAQFRKEIGKYVDATEVARLERYVFVPVELNTATDEEILAIPGVGARMLHEFKEYRPYRSIEQFRKEIGKYVDEKELARLERYVTLAATPPKE